MSLCIEALETKQMFQKHKYLKVKRVMLCILLIILMQSSRGAIELGFGPGTRTKCESTLRFFGEFNSTLKWTLGFPLLSSPTHLLKNCKEICM